MLQVQHFWLLPLFSAVIWWGMLIALLACWTGQGHPTYEWMQPTTQRIMYISDIAASNLQPIFIACAGASGLLFVLSLAAELYLRDVRRLRPGNASAVHARRALIFAISFAIVGELGILFVSIFNTRSFHKAHTAMLIVFIVFVGISSLSSVAEFGVLETDYRAKRHVVVSLSLRVIWFVIELALAIAFKSVGNDNIDASAVIEWVLSFVYPFYMFIMMWDLWPAYNKLKGHYGTNEIYPTTPVVGVKREFNEPTSSTQFQDSNAYGASPMYESSIRGDASTYKNSSSFVVDPPMEEDKFLLHKRTANTALDF